MGKGSVNTENSQMVSVDAIFTSTYHTKQVDPWPNSSASRVMNCHWHSACPEEMEPFKEHPSTCGCLITLKNKPQQKQPGQISVPINTYLSC